MYKYIKNKTWVYFPANKIRGIQIKEITNQQQNEGINRLTDQKKKLERKLIISTGLNITENDTSDCRSLAEPK